jgi:hypothetical protein
MKTQSQTLSYHNIIFECFLSIMSLFPCRTKLNRLLAKEQALRKDVGHDKSLREAPLPSDEKASLISPQSLQDTRYVFTS